VAERGFIDYVKIKDDLTPREADSLLGAAQKSGAGTVIVFFTSSPLGRSEGERALSILRSAYRRKLKIYFADDTFSHSGTFFGELSSVPDLRKKEILKLKKEDVAETDVVLSETDGAVYAARLPEPDENMPYGYYPDLTDGYAAELAIDFFYRPIVNKFKRFASYELEGFFSMKPAFVPPCGKLLYDEEVLRDFDPEKLLGDESERGKYNLRLQKKFEENYISRIAEYLKSEGLGYAVVPHESGASAEIAGRINSIPVPESFSSENLAAVTGAFAERKNAVLKIGEKPVFDKLRKFLADFGKDAEIIEAKDGEIEIDCGSAVILNNSNEIRTVKISLPEDIYVITDPERGTAYSAASGEFTFYPFGFLCLREGVPEIEPPPAVGAVMAKKRGETIFEMTSLQFAIPDEPLSGTCLEIEGDFEEVGISIGETPVTLFYAPYMVELFDFMRGAECTVTPVGGEITDISIARCE